MFRKPAKKANRQIRQKETEVVDEEEPTSSVVREVKRTKRRKNPLVQSTKKKREESESSSGSSSNDESGQFELEHAYKASGSAVPLAPRDMGATATLEIDTDISVDAQAQFERVQKQLKEGLVKDGKILYKGQAMYGAKEAKDTVKGNAASGMNRLGPMRAPAFLRQTIRIDNAPDICKDYKETGFCTFGDSCKFLHDRSDYKHGWEIERDYVAGTLNEVDNTNYEIEEEEETVPDKCFDCGEDFNDPILTKCKHMFCLSCATKTYKRTGKCSVCGTETLGLFKYVKNVPKRTDTSAEKDNSDSDEDKDKEHDHEHKHGEHCSHSEDKQPMDAPDEAAEDIEQDENDEDEEPVPDDGPQEEVEIAMEEIEDDPNEPGSDLSDEDQEEV